MEHLQIPNTPLNVSRIGLGAWAIGGWMWGGTDERDAIATIQAAPDHGINLVDTAPVYGFGTSEELVGRAIAGRRDQYVIATKVGLQWAHGKVTRNSTTARIQQEVEDSLRRLRVDSIDLYQVHWPDAHVPIDETARALESLLKAGKVRAIGVSNYSRPQMDAWRKVAPLHTCQPPYNLFERGIEKDVLPYCAQHNIITLLYGPLCRGLLSGRMGRATRFPDDDLRRYDPKFQPPRYQHYLEAVQRLDALARESGHTVLELAVRWVLDQPGASIALWGARKPKQLAPVAAAMGWSVDDGMKQEVDRILGECIPDPVGPEFMAPPEG